MYTIYTRVYTQIHTCVPHTYKHIGTSEMNIFKYFRNHHGVIQRCSDFCPHNLQFGSPHALSRYSFAAHSDGCNALVQPAFFCLPSRPCVFPQVLLCELPPSHWAVPLFLLICKIPLYSEDESTLCFYVANFFSQLWFPFCLFSGILLFFLSYKIF